jgi:hypothetical protein
MFDVDACLPAIQFPQQTAVQAQRRDARQRFAGVEVGGAGVVARQLQCEFAVGIFSKLPVILARSLRNVHARRSIRIQECRRRLFAFVVQRTAGAEQADVLEKWL